MFADQSTRTNSRSNECRSELSRRLRQDRTPACQDRCSVFLTRRTRWPRDCWRDGRGAIGSNHGDRSPVAVLRTGRRPSRERVATGPTLSPVGLLAPRVLMPLLSATRAVRCPDGPRASRRRWGLAFSATALGLSLAMDSAVPAKAVVGVLAVLATLDPPPVSARATSCSNT